MISIVVALKEPDERFVKCLSTLHNQDYPNYEIVTAGGSHVLEADAYIDGVQRARGTIIAFTNADCYVPSDWLSRLYTLLQQGHDIAGGPRMSVGDIYAWAWNTPFRVAPIVKAGIGFGWSNCMFRRHVFDKVPLRRLPVYQDLDFLARTHKADLRVAMDTSILVVHDHPLRSFWKAMAKQLIASENYTYLLRYHHGQLLGTGLGLESGLIRFLQGFLTVGRLEPRYGPLWKYTFVRLCTKVAQLAGFFLGRARDGIVVYR